MPPCTWQNCSDQVPAEIQTNCFCSGRCILLLQTQSEMGYRALHQCIWRHILGSGRVRPKSFENIHSQLGAWNPLDDWIWLDKPFLVEVLERIGPIYIDDFQNIYDVNETATFKFRFSCMGSKTCISIDWDDGSRCLRSEWFQITFWLFAGFNFLEISSVASWGNQIFEL